MLPESRLFKSSLYAGALCSVKAASGVCREGAVAMGIFKVVIVSPFARNYGETWLTGANSSRGVTPLGCAKLASRCGGWDSPRGGREARGLLVPRPNRCQSWQVTGLSWESRTTRVIRPSYSFCRACASPAASRRRVSKELSMPAENGRENEKLLCKGQPEQGAELTFMPFRSSSELLLCYAG